MDRRRGRGGVALAGSLVAAFGVAAVVAACGAVQAVFCAAQVFNRHIMKVEDKDYLESLSAAWPRKRLAPVHGRMVLPKGWSPVNSPGQGVYEVRVDWSPVHELVISLVAYLQPQHYKVIDLEPGWADKVRGMVGPDFTSAAEALAEPKFGLPPDLLIHECSAKQDVDSFLAWAASLSPGDIYELVAPRMPEGSEIPKDLGGARDKLVQVLGTWDERYFRTVDPAILEGLAAEAAARRAELPPESPEDYVEQVTRGVYVERGKDVQVVVLTPQYHSRPFTVYDSFKGLVVLDYAAEAVVPGPGSPSPALTRMARALSDESRLRILRFLGEGEGTFTDIVKFTGLAKSTVHHHMMMLRAAGLVRTYFNPKGTPERYGQRPGAAEALKRGFEGYLKK